jgi:hypothetical protein
VTESPIEQLLLAVDKLDVETAMTLFAPAARFLAVDGQRAEDTEQVRKILAEFLANLRSTDHRITAQWHVDDVWIAEVDATYELKDWMQTAPLPRAFVARVGPDGITELRAYGAHERPLSEHHTGEEGMWIGRRWIPPL